VPRMGKMRRNEEEASEKSWRHQSWGVVLRRASSAQGTDRGTLVEKSMKGEEAA